MSEKRKAPENGRSHQNETTGNQRKKQRLDAARTIQVQFATPGSSTSHISGNVPSKPGEDPNTALPSTLDVEKFVEARSFEMDSMQDAMKNARAGVTHRVWQTLPRHLRRRAASHDVRRVPARLRDKAKSEMDSKKTTRKKLPQRGKQAAVKRTETLLKRQVEKTWLETHIWHAKRMHMENLWGYRLAVTPTEKSYRPSNRASLHGCILHDASYEAIIELKGPEAALQRVLNDCGDPQVAGPGAQRFVTGSRACRTHMYKARSYPFGLIGPVEVIWCPASDKSRRTNSKTPSRKSTKMAEACSPPRSHSASRTVWIKCHPSIFELVFSAIQYPVQMYLRDAKEEGKIDVEIQIADLRDRFNIFHLIGPKASQVIHGALSPVKQDDRSEFKEFWNALGQLQTAGSAPQGMVVGIKVVDPRLEFPPKNTKVNQSKESLPDVHLPNGLWPTAKLASSEIWHGEIRDALAVPKYKKKDIDGRKSKNLVPGSKLTALRQDDRIPLLLIQSSVEASSEVSGGTNDNAKLNSRSLHGWSMIIPKGWGMAFFSSLTYSGTRVGGQRERESQHFEAGCAYFPKDYPCTDGHRMFWTDSEARDKEKWEKKPPAKRPNWEKLGTHSPWKPDWNGVLGLGWSTGDQAITLPTQRENASGLDNSSSESWLLRGVEAKGLVEFLSHSHHPEIELLTRLNQWRGKRQWGQLSVSADLLLRTCLVQVRVDIPCSGCLEDNAIIYSVLDDEAERWKTLIERGSTEVTEEELGKGAYAQEQIIGYITSGRYSLSVGRGQGLGSMPLACFLRLKEQLHRLGKSTALPLVKVRTKDSTICRAALLELAT